MNHEIKYAKYLTEQDVLNFLESTGQVRVNRKKPSHMKVGKHEIILIGGALVERYRSPEERGIAPVYKELNFMCILNDFECKLTMAGNSTMNHSRKFIFKRKFAECVLQHLPENLKENFIQAYNSQLKLSQNAGAVQE